MNCLKLPIYWVCRFVAGRDAVDGRQNQTYVLKSGKL